MNAVVEELKKVKVFYIATVGADGDPRVRPFGAVCEFGGKPYICTNNTKKCYAEMLARPRVEISGMTPDGSWIRLQADVLRDDSDEARQAMLDANPSIQGMYRVGDGIFEVLSLENVSCVRYSFTAPPVVIA